ncbi:ferritin-like domain-containing protein [Salegentibacter sp. JZCK2]|uniref:ferritin-like domain-containing protein n=1 Tax=Salegentibacter tibetensis TaxID=2873600 RepID=UPI001CCE8638|nr:ferritin-like domain-containing protein [Salegentibacter tibetensis]MBZ9731626.1 ferritin-like domain-containing protein [Salegentibacter tibetensis]
MNIIKFLDSLSDPELLTTPVSRRNGLKSLTQKGKELALVSIPFALAATSKKTAAATKAMPSAMFQASPTEVLQFALTLEYLERDFYQMGLDSGVIPADDENIFVLIRDHESSHVDLLKAALGGNAFDAPEFDFSGGLGLDPFNNYAQFLALAQGFEDTGVRAYKGQAGALVDDDALLEYALQIHSVEARHASQLRRMRGEKGWITRDNNTLPPAFSAIYAGEENTVQLGVELAGRFPNFGGVDAVTEAFDEPLTMAEVNAIAGLFLA